jgi:hypothetical protein
MDLKVGDKVRLPSNSDPSEVFTIQRFRAHGMLADIKSPHRSQVLCAPVKALRSTKIVLHIERQPNWWRRLLEAWGVSR